MYKYIVFDVDGTLIDTEKAAISSLQLTFNEVLGKNYEYEELIFSLGIPFEKTISTLNIKNSALLRRKYLENLKKGYENVKCFSGIPEILKKLYDLGKITGIVTSRTKEEIRSDPCLSELLKYIKYVVSADDTVRHKPNPEPLHKFIKLAQADITRSIYIGDTYYDYMCAYGSGMDFALALWGAKHTKDIKPDIILKDPNEILTINKVWNA